MRTVWLLVLDLTFIHSVLGKFPRCQVQWEMQREKSECHSELQQQQQQQQQQQRMDSAGCDGEWDNVSCWRTAAVGEVLILPCPAPFLLLFKKNGNLSRSCTEDGWSDVYPDVSDVCSTDDDGEPSELLFYRMVQILSTFGHSLSLIALLTSIVILCWFRKLHCTRNYIHLNLFASFVLRAAAVLNKDAMLFTDNDSTDCSTQPSLVGCKSSLVFFHYFVMANFFWLLVEGLYLHTLLLVIHTCCTRLSIYMAIGWGIPFVFTSAWIVCRVRMEDTRCWEVNDNPVPARLIDWPIMASITINFILFISIVRILVQKLRCADVGGNNQSQYRRLAKSTLLLIPLFGVNYVVFFYLMEPADKNMKNIKIFFDLGLGSFQGLLVAVLYCFLNSEVQGELRRKWRGVSSRRYGGQQCPPLAASLRRNGAQNRPVPRDSRAPSILQTETSVL